jgi:hypothetical protein
MKSMIVNNINDFNQNLTFNEERIIDDEVVLIDQLNYSPQVIKKN